MVWRAIRQKEKINLVGIDGKMDSEYYIVVLSDSLIPTADALLCEARVFQQDNAAIHPFSYTKSFHTRMT